MKKLHCVWNGVCNGMESGISLPGLYTGLSACKLRALGGLLKLSALNC